MGGESGFLEGFAEGARLWAVEDEPACFFVVVGELAHLFAAMEEFLFVFIKAAGVACFLGDDNEPFTFSFISRSRSNMAFMTLAPTLLFSLIFIGIIPEWHRRT